MLRFVKTRIKYLVSGKYAYLKTLAIGKGKLVIDLGANVGEVTEFCLACGAVVHAYEPNPYAFEVLKKRVGRYRSAILYQKAVAAKAGKMPLFLHEQHRKSEVMYSQGGSLIAGKANVGTDSVEVEVAAIADILAAHDHIDLLKVDIEGAEYDILPTIMAQAEKIGTILLETHENKGADFAEKHEAFLKALEDCPHKNKFRLDWF